MWMPHESTSSRKKQKLSEKKKKTNRRPYGFFPTDIVCLIMLVCNKLAGNLTGLLPLVLAHKSSFSKLYLLLCQGWPFLYETKQLISCPVEAFFSKLFSTGIILKAGFNRSFLSCSVLIVLKQFPII